ncbi:MAG: menaquinone biosynthesis decarboxylase [Candidatus Omnitrophica bacterium CG1_02_49_16]|nr:MAG: menaquinone biosynthesis decarboxylase [Candidatus Omnitrophica bacterium CG1_02_49_16]
MKKCYKNLREFIDALDKAGELIRISKAVDPELEITEITDRVSKSEGGGKALLFENVRGSRIPVLINAFGSYKRMAMAMGEESVGDVSKKMEALLAIKGIPKDFRGKWDLLGKLFDLSKIPPRLVSHGPCQEIVLKDNFKLSDLPILKCWPHDGGRFITLPLVFTKDPETFDRNVGVYRMHVYDDRTTGMHWQTQKDGAIHAEKVRRGRVGANGRSPLPVAVVIGADPATVFSGVVPLPYGLDELFFSGFLRNAPVELVKCKTIDMEIPAESEIVLEGFVDPDDLRAEGPFGDHTGVYTPVEWFPAFHIKCITTRKDPVYLTTIVGKPPMEDTYMGKAIEKIFLPVLKKQIPELVDMNFPMEGTFNNAVIVSIDKNYPHQANKVAHAIWGLGQLAFTKVVIIVDKSVNVQDLSAVSLAVFNNIDPKRDLFFVEGPVDTLNHASGVRDFGSKVGIDATAKWKTEGCTRTWPEEIEMDQTTKKKVDDRWKELGIG